ncbi:hypothetical protein [Streptomyces sp. IB201691-2A2]|uniref:hypothetical protein n=1 Tax=Streptomyces sp. IB201691-2A2 TaxID=2561920 RepID=UPI0021B13486|nr:hypothetical protein [Streptomyces sp. IB201691-2A2]
MRSTDGLIARLDDPDARVRAAALHALSCLRCKPDADACRPDRVRLLPRAVRLLEVWLAWALCLREAVVVGGGVIGWLAAVP